MEKSGIGGLENFVQNLVEKLDWKLVWKFGWRNKSEKLCRIFGGQIGRTTLMEKLVQKLVEKLCGKG